MNYEFLTEAREEFWEAALYHPELEGILRLGNGDTFTVWHSPKDLPRRLNRAYIRPCARWNRLRKT